MSHCKIANCRTFAGGRPVQVISDSVMILALITDLVTKLVGEGN